MSDYATQCPEDSMPAIDGGWLLYFSRSKNYATYADVLVITSKEAVVMQIQSLYPVHLNSRGMIR